MNNSFSLVALLNIFCFTCVEWWLKRVDDLFRFVDANLNPLSTWKRGTPFLIKGLPITRSILHVFSRVNPCYWNRNGCSLLSPPPPVFLLPIFLSDPFFLSLFLHLCIILSLSLSEFLRLSLCLCLSISNFLSRSLFLFLSISIILSLLQSDSDCKRAVKVCLLFRIHNYSIGEDPWD